MAGLTELLVLKIARIGRDHPAIPPIRQVEPFEHFFAKDGLDVVNLDKRDGCCTRREILTRFLLLMAVLDQGPDIVGLRDMLVRLTNDLYRREIRFLHRPVDLFREIGVVVDDLINIHDSIKSVRSVILAREMQSTPNRYNLFQYDNNQTKPLHYTVARLGVPLLLPLFLEQDSKATQGVQQKDNPTLLLDYLEQWESAEIMSQQLKNHHRYGLGKAIGDKACHLFAKWVISTFRLTRRQEKSWGDFSFEVPYDSNAGRVLWRTGYLLRWANEEAYREHNVLQPRRGKGGTTYIRATHIRGMSAQYPLTKEEWKLYIDISQNYLHVHRKKPRKPQIQRLQHIYLLKHTQEHPDDPLTIANFDDGLMYIGTHFCLNHANPLCQKCPIQELCEGYQERPQLITNYRT